MKVDEGADGWETANSPQHAHLLTTDVAKLGQGPCGGANGFLLHA